MEAGAGVKTVLERLTFYKEGQGIVGFIRVLLLVLCAMLLLVVGYKVKNPPQPVYFAITPAGAMVKVSPLSDPILSDAAVTQWAATAVQRAFSFDYVHWRDRLSDISGSFTPEGYLFFLAALRDSNALETVKQLKMVVSADITGVPSVIDRAVMSGRYTWKIMMPMLIKYQNINQTIPQPLSVIVIVQRVSAADFPDRIAINNFMPAPGAKVGPTLRGV